MNGLNKIAKMMIIESSVHYIDLFLMLEHFHNEGLKKKIAWVLEWDYLCSNASLDTS